MLKKIIFISIFSLLLPIACFANDFYAGLGMGYESADFDKKLTINTPDNTYNYYKTDDLAGSGTAGNVFAGYEWNFDRIYLATEINFSLSSLKYNGFFSETDNGLTNTSWSEFTLDKSYGVSLLPGYQVANNVRLYGRLGYQRGQFKYSEYKTNADDRTGVTERDWLNGIRYGIRIDTSLTPNMGVRLEFDQTKYNTFTNTSFPMPNNQFRKMQLTPYVNQVSLNFVYRFL